MALLSHLFSHPEMDTHSGYFVETLKSTATNLILGIAIFQYNCQQKLLLFYKFITLLLYTKQHNYLLKNNK